MNKGTAHIRGPATKEEKHQLELWRKHKAVFEEELIELRAMLEDPNLLDRDDIVAEITKTEKVVGFMTEVLRIGRIPDIFPDLEQVEREAEAPE